MVNISKRDLAIGIGAFVVGGIFTHACERAVAIDREATAIAEDWKKATISFCEQICERDGGIESEEAVGALTKSLNMDIAIACEEATGKKCKCCANPNAETARPEANPEKKAPAKMGGKDELMRRNPGVFRSPPAPRQPDITKVKNHAQQRR